MNRIRIGVVAAVAAAACCRCGVAEADLAPNLIQNGDFGTGSFSGWTESGNTHFTGVAGSMMGFSPSVGGHQAYFGPIFGSTTLSQTVATVPGVEYTLSFDLGVARGRPNRFSASVGDSTVMDERGLSPTSGNYESYSFTIAATAASETVQFRLRDLPSFLFLDNIRFSPASAVPLPPSILLLGSGLAASGLRRRRPGRMSAGGRGGSHRNSGMVDG